MKEKIKFVIYMILFISFMIFSVVGYKKVSERNSTNKYYNNTNVEQKHTKLKEFEVYIDDSHKISVKQLIGKPIVINIWTSWCGYCGVEMPYFNDMYLKEKDNINFMMINATGDRDSIENANKFVNENNYDFKPYYDLNLEAIQKLGIYSYPTTIFVDKEGYIDSIKVGLITKEELKSKIEKLK